MKLDRTQQEMLDGKYGEARRFALEKLVDFGNAVGAEEMVPLSFVYVGLKPVLLMVGETIFLVALVLAMVRWA